MSRALSLITNQFGIRLRDESYFLSTGSLSVTIQNSKWSPSSDHNVPVRLCCLPTSYKRRSWYKKNDRVENEKNESHSLHINKLLC